MDDQPCYFTNWEPHPVPALVRDHLPALGVYESSEPSAMPVGVAFGAGSVDHPRGRAQVFRLVVAQVEVEGRFLLAGGRFVRLGDAADIGPG